MRPKPARHVLLGSPGGIAGTVYGTIVVMATVTAGSEGGQTDALRLAVVVGVTVVVLWIAHVYSHALGESLERGRRLDRAEVVDVAGRELGIPAAAVAPIAALVLAALGLLGEQTAVWLALGLGMATLAVQGVRYANARRARPKGDVRRGGAQPAPRARDRGPEGPTGPLAGPSRPRTPRR